MQHQHAVLAMAGPAEAAEFYALMIGWAALAIIGVVTAIGFWKPFWTPACIAAGLTILTTLLFLPWQAFAALTAKELEDPDVQAWVDSWRQFGVAWIIAVVAVVTCLATVKIRRTRRAA